MTCKPANQRPPASVDAELLALAAEFQTIDAQLLELNAQAAADPTMDLDAPPFAAVHDRWWAIVNKVIDTPAFTVPGWAAKGGIFPAVLRDLVGLDNLTADHRLTLSLTLDMQRHGHPELDADLLAACAAFDAAHAETKAQRGETDAEEEALARAIERWYAALHAAVAIPARTAPGQQAKLRVVYVALQDALKDEPTCGNREEFAALRVLAELIGADDLVLPAEDPKPAAAPADDAGLDRLSEDGVVQDYAIFDLESVFADMRADIEIIGCVATSDRQVSTEAWVRIQSHLELALQTLESSWQVAFENRHVLHNALKAERAEVEYLKREQAAPGSPKDIERAEAMRTMLRTMGRLAIKQADEVLPAA